MSILRLTDGRLYEVSETAHEMFEFLTSGSSSPEEIVYLLARQAGRRHARYKGITLRQGLIASAEDDGLGYATVIDTAVTS